MKKVAGLAIVASLVLVVVGGVLALRTFPGKLALLVASYTLITLVVMVVVGLFSHLLKEDGGGNRKIAQLGSTRRGDWWLSDNGPGDDIVAIITNNNWWFVAFSAWTVATFFYAIGHPGPSLFPDAFRELPGYRTTADTTGCLVYGDRHFQEGFQENLTCEEWVLGKVPEPINVPVGATWFWWEAFVTLLVWTIAFLPYAFHDEVERAWKAAWARAEEKRTAVAPQGAAATPQPHATAGGTTRSFLWWEFLGDLVAGIAGEIVGKLWVEKRRTA